jgi:hypothetical protein
MIQKKCVIQELEPQSLVIWKKPRSVHLILMAQEHAKVGLPFFNIYFFNIYFIYNNKSDKTSRGFRKKIFGTVVISPFLSNVFLTIL